MRSGRISNHRGLQISEIDPIRPDSHGGFTSTPRERLLSEIILVSPSTFSWPSDLCTLCSSTSFVYFAISFSPKVFL
jgi:hypothetical protein